MKSNQKMKFSQVMMAFALGLSGELYYPMPGLGVMSFIEIFSYSLCMVILLMNWNKMGRYTKRTIGWGWVWAAAAAVAGLISGVPMKACLKEIVVCSSSWAIVAVAWYILKKNAKLYLVYLVGAGIGAYIGLHHFKQGALLAVELRAMGDGKSLMDLLVEKQVYPIYANLIFYGCVLPFFIFSKKMPAFLVMAGCFGAGFYLLINGGSRSIFGFYLVAALTVFGVVYAKRLTKVVLRSKTSMFLFGGLAILLIFTTYKIMAMSGGLGEEEKIKYEDQFKNASDRESGLMGRGNYYEACEMLVKNPLGNGPKFGLHAVVTSSMVKEGVVGLAYWIFFLVQVIWFMSARLIYLHKYSGFIMFMMTSAVWAALGSPFGARHVFFVALAFISLCRDDPLYGANGLFEFSQRYLDRHSKGARFPRHAPSPQPYPGPYPVPYPGQRPQGPFYPVGRRPW